MQAVSTLPIGLEVLDHVPTGICIIDRDHTVLFWNSCLEDWTGIGRQEIQGAKIGQYFPLLESPIYTIRIEGIFSGGAPVILSSQLHRSVFPTVLPGGQERIQHTTITAVPIPESDAYHALFSVADVTELTRHIAELRKAKNELRRATDCANNANQAKSRFLANMSHEIRTPMTAILGYTDLVQRQMDLCPNQFSNEPHHGEAIHHLEVIRSSGKYLLALLNDILDLSKIESGKMEFECVSFSIIGVLGDLVRLFKNKANAKGINLDLRFNNAIPAAINTDPTRIRQALVNLTSNAVKFTSAGSVTIEADLNHAEGLPVIQIKIIDTGFGIEPERMDSIFEPFVQADSTVTRQYGGTGLGLTITKKIMEALGGSITLDSVVQQGTTFCLAIPTGSLDQVEMIENPEQYIAHYKSRDTREVLDEVRLTGKVLLADDTPPNRYMIQQVLELMGLEVTAVANGREACEAVSEQHFDLILMDIHMPVMGGIEATQHIRASGLHMPVIALTADAMQETQDACAEADFNGFASKPIVYDQLAQELAKFLMHAVPEANRLGADTCQTYQNSALTDKSETKPIDPEAMIKEMHISLEDYFEILEQTLPWLEEQRVGLLAALDADDHQVLGEQAHAIKGASGNLAMQRVYDTAFRLEMVATGQQSGDVRQLVEQLTKYLDKIQHHAADLLSAFKANQKE